MNKQYRFILILLACSVGTAIALRAWLHPPLKLTNAQLLPAPKPMMQDYVLTNGDVKLHLNQIKGHWMLLFFGYTSCPDVCPLELQKLAQMLKHFDAVETEKKPLVIFVSLDPERDKPEQLKKYVNYFHDAMVGVTGTNIELASLAGFFGASFNRNVMINGKEYLVEAGADMPVGTGDHYLVNHTSRIFIVDTKAQYVGSFSPPYSADVLANDMTQLLER